jgi:hypothetical protein
MFLLDDAERHAVLHDFKCRYHILLCVDIKQATILHKAEQSFPEGLRGSAPCPSVGAGFRLVRRLEVTQHCCHCIVALPRGF